MSSSFNDFPFLTSLGLEKENAGVFDGKWGGSGDSFDSVNTRDRAKIAVVKGATPAEYEKCITALTAAGEQWRKVPAPKRGEVVRRIGMKLREKLESLGQLVALEMGKIKAEGIGEVQEFIDMCDLAAGMSRQLEGKVLPSERPGHVMLEMWNPLGIVGCITAFNFPVAPFGWNLTLALIAGNVCLWKGAETTPLTSIAVVKIVTAVFQEMGYPTSVLCLVNGKGDIGHLMASDKRVNLMSFTGSTAIGKIVATTVQERFGKVLLELGGNNMSIVMDDADLDIAVRGSVFAAVGTCGQRCTTLRRLCVHEKVYDDVLKRLTSAYKSVRIGDPLEDGVLCGPLHHKRDYDNFFTAIEEAKAQGGKVVAGGEKVDNKMGGFFVAPTIIEIAGDAAVTKKETFAPILYVHKMKALDEAIAINNSVPQGLSSSLYTRNMQHLFSWIGPEGSDCGLVNVNIGPSGAEIGGAFGGEKETGGGRESGSDAWKQYMRRSTCTINFSDSLPLAQGIKFDL